MKDHEKGSLSGLSENDSSYRTAGFDMEERATSKETQAVYGGRKGQGKGYSVILGLQEECSLANSLVY